MNKETLEETLIETLSFDISCLLFPSDTVLFNWNFDRMKSNQILFLNVCIKSDVPLLSEYLHKKLNPLQVLLVSIKDIPFHTEPKFKPVYAEVEFVDG